MNFNINMKATALAALAFAAVGCSSGVKKVDFPSDANPADEVTRLETEIKAAVAGQEGRLGFGRIPGCRTR